MNHQLPGNIFRARICKDRALNIPLLDVYTESIAETIVWFSKLKQPN